LAKIQGLLKSIKDKVQLSTHFFYLHTHNKSPKNFTDFPCPACHRSVLGHSQLSGHPTAVLDTFFAHPCCDLEELCFLLSTPNQKIFIKSSTKAKGTKDDDNSGWKMCSVSDMSCELKD